MEVLAARGAWFYALLFGLQTLGAFILFWIGVPLYQRAVADPAAHEAELATLFWLVPAMALMQAVYWTAFRRQVSPPTWRNPLLGHITLFVGRFVFVFASALFSFMFLAPRPELSVPTSRFAVTVFGLFCLFCYTLEVERLGRALLSRSLSL